MTQTLVCRYVIGILLLALPAAHGQTAAEAWVRRYNSEFVHSGDTASKVVSDNDGNVIVAGDTADLINARSDMLIIKYSGAGVPLWTNRYDGPDRSDDRTAALAVDHNGDVFVLASSVSAAGYSDYITIAYSAAGVPLWTNRYDGPDNADDSPSALAVDATGNVFVTGSSGKEDAYDYVTIAYSGAGVPLWTNRYDGPDGLHDSAVGIAAGPSGNVFVTGRSRDIKIYSAYATVAYSGAGVPLWTNRFSDGESSAAAIGMDSNGNVFVTGYVFPSPLEDFSDFATIAYSGSGLALWTNYHGGPGNSFDQPYALTVDGDGNVFVTGYSSDIGGKGNWGYATIKYSGAGIPLWTNRHEQAASVAVDHAGNVFVTGSSGVTELSYVTIAYSGSGAALWTNGYSSGSGHDDNASAVAVDGSGNVFVTGSSYDHSAANWDYTTIAYSAAGAAVWTNHYDGPANGNDSVSAVAVDNNNGNVFITGTSVGYSASPDYVTVAYSAAGVPLWTNRYDGGLQDYTSAIAVDSNNGNVFVTGASLDLGSQFDYVTIAYSGAGVPLWTNRYNGPANSSDMPSAVAADGNGNVFVTGSSTAPLILDDYATVAYSAAGVALWTNRYNGTGNGTDEPLAMAVDRDGNVFVTGRSYGGPSQLDFATVAYSGTGMALWTNRYNGPGNVGDGATGIAVDNAGRIFVTGESLPGYLTIAYSTAGVALWTNQYSAGNGYDTPSAIAVDRNGNVFVTGSSGGSGSFPDYATVAYSAAGVALWTNRYDGPGHNQDSPSAVAVDTSGNVFVTGYSLGAEGSFDFATIVYSAAGVPLSTNRYNGPANGHDMPPARTSLAIGPGGAAYVAGSSDGNYASEDVTDYALVKYVLQPQLAIQPRVGESSTVNLQVSGAPGSAWSIDRAPTITGPWSHLGSATIPNEGMTLFEDSNPPPDGAFYRARAE